MTKKKVNLCIVKSSADIRQKLLKRFAEPEFAFSLGKISKDAEEKGMIIEKAALSRYLNKAYPVRRGLTQEAILWLCIRYNIDVKLMVTIENRDDDKSLKKLKKIWPATPLPVKVESK